MNSNLLFAQHVIGSSSYAKLHINQVLRESFIDI